MGFWDIILQIVPLVWLWNTASEHLGYIKDLHDNVDTLMTEANELKRKRDEFEEDVKAAESVGKKKLRCVDSWFNDVDKIVPEVDSIKLEFDQGTTNPFSRHKFGKRVIEKIKDVKQLQDQGVFNVVATSPRQLPMQEVPEQLQHQSTSEETLEKITQALFDEEIGTVCVYGMGGIGKTTLMKAVYNKFLGTGDFHQVIWVTVSKDLNLQVIQQTIGNKLEVEFRGNERVEEKRDRLYARLSNMRFMLILDDLWEAFSLDQVGIPQPSKQNRCKIAITTRLIAVISVMKADREVKVKALSSEEAWDLFCSKTGDVVLQPEIQQLAKEVVKECGGLPLAIKTVGGAMCRKGKKELWQNALWALRASAVPEVQGMQRQVFLPLKLSYDYLEDHKIQLCFLYCSLYPEDFHIPVERLVKYWAFEDGLIDNVTSLDQALKRGHGILERLKDACLLEEGASELSICRADRAYVRMHDLLRDLAIWITSQSFSSSSFFQTSKFLTKTGEGLEQPPAEKMWEGMRRISLMHNKIRDLRIIPNCPDLVSLFLAADIFLHESDRVPLTIHDSFFQLMPKLQILDLSHTGIKSLPPSLSLLVNLSVLVVRGCRNLQELPPLGYLRKLQLIDLCLSGIINLPQGTASLAKLKCLNLSYVRLLSAISCNSISGMTSLVDLRLLGLKPMISVDTWREIAKLRDLTCLTIQLPSLDAFTVDDLKHPMWSRLSRFVVHIGFKYDVHDVLPFDRKVLIYNCRGFPSQIKSLIGNAEFLFIKQCRGLGNLPQIIGDSKNLKCVELYKAQGVKCCIDWREVGGNNALDCLEELRLDNLPSLQKVFDGGPPKGFHRLREITIISCRKLTFVFSSSMVQHLQRLEVLHVQDCIEIEEIVEGIPGRDTVLQRLSSLRLRRLPKLMTICSQPLVLTSIDQCIEVCDCPELKKLPILCSRTQQIRAVIRADREWWEGIEWEDEHSKSLYSTIYEETEESLQEA